MQIENDSYKVKKKKKFKTKVEMLSVEYQHKIVFF